MSEQFLDETASNQPPRETAVKPIIRRATSEDTVGLAELDAYVQSMHADAHPHIWREPDHELSRQFFQEQLSRDDMTTLVLDLDGGIVGYALYQLIDKEGSGHRHPRRVLKLEHIAISKDCEGRGFGALLLDQLKSVAIEEQANDVELSVWRFNVHAIGFYERNGFVAQAQRMTWIVPRQEQ